MHAASIHAYSLVYRVLAISQPLEISYNACQSPGQLFVSGNRRPNRTPSTIMHGF